MAICNAYRQVAWRTRPSHINNSGSRETQPNQTKSTKRRCAPIPSSRLTHTHTHTLQRRPRREPTPHRAPSAIPPVRVAPSALRLPLPPRRFRAIRGSPPHLLFPPPHASGPPVGRPTTTAMAADSGKGARRFLVTLDWSGPIRVFLSIVR